jgi:hypothetical protein
VAVPVYIYNLRIRHDIKLEPPRGNDIPIMRVLYANHARGQDLISPSQCKLHLKYFCISDIANSTGSHLMENTWEGNSCPILYQNSNAQDKEIHPVELGIHGDTTLILWHHDTG